MANAIKMILRCARYGAPAEYHDYGPETIDPVTDHLPEEPMGNGERLEEEHLVVSEPISAGFFP